MATGMTTSRPSTRDEVRAVLARARAEGRSVRPVGSGIHLGVGGEPPEDVLPLPMTGLCRVRSHRPQDWMVTVEAGITLRDLAAALARSGQMLPLDPWGGYEATVGGVLASGLSGPLSTGYGGPGTLTLALKVILADGRQLATGAGVIKNVAGYDLTRLYLGSLGSLGVIAEATLRVHPLPPRREVLLGSYGDAAEAVAAARGILVSPLRPEAVEILRSPGAPWQVAVQVAGTERVVARKVRDAMTVLGGARGAAPPLVPPAAAVLQLAVPDTDPAAPLEECARIFPDGSMSLRAGSLAGELFLPEAAEDLPDRIDRLRRQGTTRVTVLRLPARWRGRVDPYGMEPSREERALRRMLDPDRILNPGVHLADREEPAP